MVRVFHQNARQIPLLEFGEGFSAGWRVKKGGKEKGKKMEKKGWLPW